MLRKSAYALWLVILVILFNGTIHGEPTDPIPSSEKKDGSVIQFDNHASALLKSSPQTLSTGKTLGKISDMTKGGDPQYVYALDQDNQILYEIDSVNQVISDTVTYPYPEPLAMTYSELDNDLYMVSKSSGSVVVYDLDTSIFSEIPFSSVDVGCDIEVAPGLRRIYVLAPHANDSILHIIDMDSGQVLLDEEVGGSYMVMDESRQKIFTARCLVSPSILHRYSVENDLLILEQKKYSYGVGRGMSISSDGLHITFPESVVGEPGYFMFDHDATELENVVGRWKIGSKYNHTEFSPDDQVLYVTERNSYDHNLYVMDAANYWMVRKLPFPNCGDYSIFTPNVDGTTIVGFSYDTKNNNEHQIYFFHDVQLPPDPPDHPLGKVSDITAGDDPTCMYALDNYHKRLYTLNPLTHQVVDKLILPHSEPMALAYSVVDRKLYIASRWSGSVDVYDPATSTFSEIPFDPEMDGLDIAVAPLLRRIYVTSKGESDFTLFIIDMDSKAVLLKAIIEGTILVVDQDRAKLYIKRNNATYRYSVANDVLLLEQTNALLLGGEETIKLSPDGSCIAIPYIGGYTALCLDALELDNIMGAWQLEGKVYSLEFSRDGNAMFIASEDHLNVLHASEYWLYDKFPFPNSSDYSLIASNSDGLVAVGFSFDTSGQDDFSFYYFEDVKVPAEPPPHPLGKISDMICGKDPEFVYAVDQDFRALYAIGTTSDVDILGTQVYLPEPEPQAMAFSDRDNSIYLVSRYSGSVTVYDLDTSTFGEFPFSVTKDGGDIEVAPRLRRIYVLTPPISYNSELFIVDMDTGEVLLENVPVTGSSLALDEEIGKLYTADSGKTPSTMCRYSIEDDDLVLEQTVNSGGKGRKIGISNDGLHIIFPCALGNGAGYTLFDYDACDLLNVFGEWDIGKKPQFAKFSPDDKILYGTCADYYDYNLYVMDAKSYLEITKYPFPNCNYYAVFTPNRDGSVVVGFSYNTYYEIDYKIYLFPGH